MWIYGQPFVGNPARTAGVGMLGVDETRCFLRATPQQWTRFVSVVVDLGRPAVVDLTEGAEPST